VQYFPCAEDADWTPKETSEATRLQARAKLGLAPDAVVLTTFGFISGYKGHRTVARSLECLPDSHVFLIAGGRHPEGRDTTLDTLLKETKKEYWLEDPGASHLRLIVTGALTEEEIARVWEATDIVVCCYDDVPFSMSAALTDALQSGKPIVASEIPAFVEMNEMGRCLALVPPGASYELAMTIRKIMTHPELRKRLCDHATQYARRHTWKRFAEETIHCYTAAEQSQEMKKDAEPLSGLVPASDFLRTS
jgi:glycosyltransferase involved in cell wall biosynthesis